MKINHFIKAFLVIAFSFCLIAPLKPASAADGATLSEVSGFISSVTDGQPNVVRGVYVPGILALRVLQQPSGDPGTVLRLDGVATQFISAARNHVIGLLAHDNLAGATFSQLKVGQEVRIIYGDGRVDYFIVNQLARFQAPQPNDRYNNYVDLSSNIAYTTQEIFSRFYDGEVHVTFQTCILKDDNSSWGRLFVTAIPIPPHYIREINEYRVEMSLAVRKIEDALNVLAGDLSLR
jgi:hypothetical protein